MSGFEADSKPDIVHEHDIDSAAGGLKLDPHGFPLNPQPSNDPRGD